jgi:hypothetical protein
MELTKTAAVSRLAAAVDVLAEQIARFAQSDGDHTTLVPGFTLHRRSAATEPIPCIYGFGLGVVAQGDKRITLGEEVFDYGPG